MGTMIMAAETGYTRLFNLDAQLLHDSILLAIAVFVLFLLLSYLLFNPARKMLQGRKQKIADELKDAADDKETAAKLKAEYEEKLKNVDKEVEKIISDARQNALIGAAMIEDEARDEAHRIVKRAEEEAALEKSRAMDEMKNEIIAIASIMAGKVVAANIDTTVQQQLLDETLREMGEATWQS
jgi:F-type H+-transporting ATPase subunit b